MSWKIVSVRVLSRLASLARAIRRLSRLEAKKPLLWRGGVTVEYTLNAGPLQTATWTVCKGDGCFGQWQGAGIPFAKALYDKAILRMTVRPRYLASSNLTFAIVGAKEAFEPVAKACK